MSSSFLATSPGVRSSSSAICFCLAGSRILKHSQLARQRQRVDRERQGRAESLQVTVNDVFHRHVVRAVHEMVSADHTVSFLPHIPGGGNDLMHHGRGCCCCFKGNTRA